jgi:bacterioferritin B
MRENPSFTELLRDQVRAGLTAAHQYLAAAVYFDEQDLPELAGQTYARSAANHGHAMRMVQYLLDRDVPIRIGGLGEVRSEFDSPRAAIAFLLDCERVTTTQISALAAAARDSNDFLGEQFVQWFLAAQVDDVAAMTTLLTVLDRQNNLFDVEQFIRRELRDTVRVDTTAPRMAGAS